MNEALDLYVEQCDDEWQVYFKASGGCGPCAHYEVLDCFPTKEEAVAFAQDQIDSADFSDCDGVGQVVIVE